MLGLNIADTCRYRSIIIHVAIQVVSHSTLRFILHDGQFIDRDWENPSRRESWTDEMKQAARERQLALNETEEKHE